jgi:transposase
MCWGSEMIRSMARKNYSDEFRRQAVDLYESTPGATVRGIADDLGVERGTLRHWLELYGTGKKTAADGTLTQSPLKPSGSSSSSPATGPVPGETPELELVRLRARVAELEASEQKLSTEREILRSGAKYFAGETRW